MDGEEHEADDVRPAKTGASSSRERAETTEFRPAKTGASSSRERAETTEFRPDETPDQRFKRLAEKRVTRTLDDIRLIGNLASSQYEFSAQQIQKIMGTLRDALSEVENQFNRKLENKRKKFQL